MGYYITSTKAGPLSLHGKAEDLIKNENAVKIESPPLAFPTDKAVICVVDNGPFEAAAFAYSKNEMDYFAESDGRPKQWLLMDINRAKELSGF